MYIERGELRIDQSIRDWVAGALADPRFEVLPITPAIAARTVHVAQVVRQDPSDHLIAATAMEHGVPLITRDAALQRLGGLETLW